MPNYFDLVISALAVYGSYRGFLETNNKPAKWFNAFLGLLAAIFWLYD